MEEEVKEDKEVDANKLLEALSKFCMKSHQNKAT